MITAGGILSDSNDMAKYALFHLNSGRVGGNQVIPKVKLNRFMDRNAKILKTCFLNHLGSNAMVVQKFQSDDFNKFRLENGTESKGISKYWLRISLLSRQL